MPKITTKGCALHRIHVPPPLTFEEHHIVPQSWQQFWRPDGRPTFEPDHDHPDPRAVTAVALWDPRTVRLGPTCHRNVHYWLVKLMQASSTEDPLDAYKLVHSRSREYAVAFLGMCRWREAGGSLGALRGKHLYGYA